MKLSFNNATKAILMKLNFKFLITAILITVQSSVLCGNQTISNEEKAGKFGSLVNAYNEGRKGYDSRIYDKICTYVNQDESVLDIGCGTGLSTAPLFDRFEAINVHGCDHDQIMLDSAQKNLKGREAQFKLGTAKKNGLPYENGKFGLVTMFMSFHWFCNAEAAEEISKKLKDKGYVYIVGGIGRPCQEKVNEIMERILNCKMVDPKENYHPEQVLTDNGFTLVEKGIIPIQEQYTVKKAVERTKSSSYWNYVGKDKEKETAEALEEMYNQEAKDGFVYNINNQEYMIFQKN